MHVLSDNLWNSFLIGAAGAWCGWQNGGISQESRRGTFLTSGVWTEASGHFAGPEVSISDKGYLIVDRRGCLIDCCSLPLHFVQARSGVFGGYMRHDT